MEKYKASRSEEVEGVEPVEKSQKEIDFEKNKNTSEKIAQGVGMYFGGPEGGELAKMATQTKAGQMVTDVAAEAITKNPVLNKVSTKLNDSGIVDAAGDAMDIMGSASASGSAAKGIGAGTSATGSAGTSATKGLSNGADGASKSLGNSPQGVNTGNDINTSNNSSLTDSASSSNIDTKSLGNITDLVTGKTSRKIAIIACASFIFLIISFMVGASSQKDFYNLALTNNTVLASTSNGTRQCTPSEISSKVIYVGDSRMVGMQSAVSDSTSSYIAQVSQGYDWLKNTASSELEAKLGENPGAIVVFNLGVNDLYNISNYINYYKELFAKYPTAKFYILSVNPVDEALTNSNGYSQNNADIESFNSSLSSEFPSQYLDSYSSIKDNLGTTDGIHYTDETYKSINDFVMNSLSTSSGITCGAASGDVVKQLEDVGRWYIENVNTYQDRTSGKGSGHRKYYSTPFGTREFGDDCTEFVAAYMSYVCGSDISESYSGDMVDPNGSWASEVANCNWKAYSSDEVGGTLLPGDVLISHKGALYSKKGEHAEVYINESSTFGWGSIKKQYPTNNSIETSIDKDGHTHFKDRGHDYITVYRYEGVTTSTDASSSPSTGGTTTSNINIKKMVDSSFSHGSKPKSNQKYIMLHDTEMSANAEGVINSWKSSGNGVAAHFVVDRDGTVIQAVELDNITHHAGWGGPGDFDSKFGVGKNDGLGNGDDLKGTTKTGYDSYTSYGMNSYSIGIEMCHVNGEDYTEAQLNAVDSLIQYIDSYYGFESTIIDHKDWRPSNSDTDAKFSTYLNNYKSTRHH